MEEIDPAAELPPAGSVGVAEIRGPVDLRHVSRRLVDEGAEMASEQLVRAPAGQAPARRVGDEGEPGVGIDRPDEVGRILDEVPIAGLGLAEELVQFRVGQCDRGLVGKALEEAQLVGHDLARLAIRDRQRPDHLAARRPQRGRGHRPQAETFRRQLVVGLVRDPRISRVVGRPDGPDLRCGQAVDPAAERELHRLQPTLGVRVHPARDDDGDQVGPVVRHPGQMGPVGAEEPPRLLDDAGQELVRVAERRDPRGDVSQGVLGLGSALDLAPRPVQLLDQPGVRDGDRGLGSERPDDPRIVVVEGVRPLRVHLEGAERSRFAADRGDDHRPVAGPIEEEVVDLGVREHRLRVLGGRDHPVLRDGRPRGAEADGDRHHSDLVGGEQVGDAGVERPADLVTPGVNEVEYGAIRVDEPLGGVDDLLEQRARIADRGDLGGDLAERLLRLGAARQLGRRPVELLDQPGVLDRDRGLVGEALEKLGLVVVVLVDLDAAHRDRPERPRLAPERCRQDGSEPGLPDERVGPRNVLEARIGEVVARPERLAGRDGPAGDPLPDPELRVEALLARPDRVLAGRVRPAQGHAVVLEHVDPCRRRSEQPACLVHGLLEDRVGVAQGRDVRRDLAHGTLGVGPVLDLLAGSLDGLDEAGVADGDRRLMGERLGKGHLLRPEGGTGPAADLEHAEQAVLDEERRDDERLDPVGAHGLVEIAVVDERSVGEVVVDDDRATLLDRLAGGSMAVGLALLVDGGATDVGTGAEEGVADATGAAPDQVDPDALGMEEAGSLVDDVLE